MPLISIKFPVIMSMLDTVHSVIFFGINGKPYE
jgi:hypothetical protein